MNEDAFNKITLAQMEQIRDRAQAQLEAEYREMRSRRQTPQITWAIVRIVLAEARKILSENTAPAKGDPNCPTCWGSGCFDCNEEIAERAREALADERRDRARSYADGFEAGSNS
jgi:hypothetical protein